MTGVQTCALPICGQGDLLVTVKVAVPPNLEGAAKEALEAYAVAERSGGFDPRAGWAGNR